MEEGDSPEPEPGQARPARLLRPLVYQATVAIVALALFLVLLDVLLDYQHPVLSGVVPNLGRGTWITVLLAALAALLVIQVLLLALAAKSIEPSLRALAHEAFDIVRPAATSGGALLIGCPACGTAFEHQPKPGDPTTFECPNCRRTGHLSPGARRRSAHLSEHPCSKCGNTFKAYHDTAECPVCHTRQSAA